MSKQSQKGREFENEMVAQLGDVYEGVDHMPKKGINDAGDIKIPGVDLYVSCKKQNTLRLPEWIRTARSKNENWLIFYADDRRLTDSVGTIAICDADFLIGLMSWAQDAVEAFASSPAGKTLLAEEAARVGA